MNNKTIAALFLVSSTLPGIANANLPNSTACNNLTNKYSYEEYEKIPSTNEAAKNAFNRDKAAAQAQCESDQRKAGMAATSETDAKKYAENGVSEGEKCKDVFESVSKELATLKQQQQQSQQVQIPLDSRPIAKGKSHRQCLVMKAMSNEIDGNNNIKLYSFKETQKFSQDQKFKCDKPYSFTGDYDECIKALAAYNFIINSEAFMNLQQTVRTDVKNNNISKEAVKAAEAGDAQTAMFDSAIESNKHMKQMEAEKAAGYTMAVGALGRAYSMIPDEEEVLGKCKRSLKYVDQEFMPIIKADDCKALVKEHKRDVLANKDIKGALFEAITQFTAKGVAAGIKMKQYDTKAKAIAQAAKPIQDEGEDMMLEFCQAAPNDPACITRGSRVTNSGNFGAGDFSLGGEGGNNVFGPVTGDGSDFGEVGADTNLDDKNEVSDINSPFQDEAKIAKGILDPAAAAQTQASGGAQGGGGGGGGGVGASGASLGSDLEGANPEGDKEAQIKAGKVSGVYGAAGGGGFKGVSRGKEDSNPFASLFDQKGGVVDEDRSIASGDIDGKASGLFEKISKRYGQIQADKRVEAKNLE